MSGFVVGGTEIRGNADLRCDVCVIPALSVIAEAVGAWEILAAALQDYIKELARGGR